MIRVSAKISLISGEYSSLWRAQSNIPPIDIAKDVNSVLGKKVNGSNPFILGITRFGQNGAVFESLQYYMGQEFADQNGVFNNKYILTIVGEYLTTLTILFDDYNNQYPYHITINGVDYTNDDPMFTINAEQITPIYTDNGEIFEVIIHDWSEPYYPLKIQGIYKSADIDIDYRNLISLETNISDRSNFVLPSWGIISNQGRISFNDSYGEIRDYSEEKLLTSKMPIRIYLNNTLSKRTKKVGDYLTKRWDYENNSRKVSVTFADNLTEWQDILIEEVKYDPSTEKNLTFEWFYKYLYELTPAKYSMLPFDSLDENTKTILSNTAFEHFILESKTLWNAWSQLCQACQCHIWKNEGGSTICYYNGGN